MLQRKRLKLKPLCLIQQDQGIFFSKEAQSPQEQMRSASLPFPCVTSGLTSLGSKEYISVQAQLAPLEQGVNHLTLELAIFFLWKAKSNNCWLHGPGGFHSKYSTLPLTSKSSCRLYQSKRVWLCLNKTLFTKANGVMDLDLQATAGQPWVPTHCYTLTKLANGTSACPLPQWRGHSPWDTLQIQSQQPGNCFARTINNSLGWIPLKRNHQSEKKKSITHIGRKHSQRISPIN